MKRSFHSIGWFYQSRVYRKHLQKSILGVHQAPCGYHHGEALESQRGHRTFRWLRRLKTAPTMSESDAQRRPVPFVLMTSSKKGPLFPDMFPDQFFSLKSLLKIHPSLAPQKAGAFRLLLFAFAFRWPGLLPLGCRRVGATPGAVPSSDGATNGGVGRAKNSAEKG